MKKSINSIFYALLAVSLSGLLGPNTLPAYAAETTSNSSIGIASSPANASLSAEDSSRGNSFSLAAIAIFDQGEISSCSGVTLNSRWVLSAAHCFTGNRSLDSYTVFTDTRSSAERIIFIKGADLALVELTGDYPSVGCTLLPTTPPKRGKNTTISVFRDTGGISTLSFTINSAKHMADNPAVNLSAHPMISLIPSHGTDLTRDGDSGAGVFTTGSTGDSQLQGIVSGVGIKNNTVLAEDLSRHTSEIYKIVGQCTGQ